MASTGWHKAMHSNRMIGVSLGARTTAEAELALQDIARSAHIVELRLDFMVEYDLTRLLRDRPCPVIVTNRPEREGGRFRGNEEDRVRPLLEAIDLGAEYVDIEHDATHLLEDLNQTHLIASYHDFSQMPGNVAEIHRDLVDKGADVVKIAGMARCAEDNVRILNMLSDSSVPTIGIAMGEAGLISRLLTLRYDSCFLTYASLGNNRSVAPGQLPVAVMREVYCAENIGSDTSVYGVLSDKSVPEGLLTSLNSATREAGLDAVWVPFIVPGSKNDSLADVINSYRFLPVAGYLVSESHHKVVSNALDDIESEGCGERINLIRLVNDQLVGGWMPSVQDAFSHITGKLGTKNLEDFSGI